METPTKEEVVLPGSEEQAVEGSVSSSIDSKREKALLRKLDLALIPIIMLLYLFSFLDRVNIGNAKLYGLEEDLGLKGDQYQVTVSILFVTYCSFEVPSNLVLKKFKPGRYISVITIIWGVIATLTGLVHSYGALIACRLLLGIFEAGLFPGLLTYLTMFYTKKELALRVGYLFVSAALAGAVGGLIAYGIGFMDGTSGLRAWRWILIIEGLPSVVTGVACWLVLPNSPDSAKFLNDEERLLLVTMRQREVGQTVDAQKFHWADVKEGAKDWHLWIFSIAAFCEDIMLYGFSTFLPTIIKGLGTWTAPEVQALTIPVYAVGAISYLIVARLSDAQQRRGIYASAFAFISVIGYILLISNKSSAASFVGCFLVATGLYVSVGIPLAWLPSNKPRYGKRALATGMQLTCGNIAGVAAPFLFQTSDAPKYYTGYGVSLALITLSGSIFAFMNWYYARTNRNRATGKEDWKIEGKTDKEIDEMGDYNPRYIYTI
ncbi:putative MFS transporter [Xylogone sp. PMI_703]|nr:putative MFS transporter [Xylogone sp. PMI_703]